MKSVLASAAPGLLALLAGCAEADRPVTDGEPPPFVVEADGALALRVGRDVARVRTRAMDRGGVSVRSEAVERFSPRGDGAEQTWTFGREPAGDGDLIVRVAVDDLTFVGTSTCGAQYRSQATGNGLCYGRATWVDARGERTAVPWSIDAQGIGMRVPADVLEGAAYPAVLDPIIGPEIEVGDFAWGPTRAHERWLDAAAGDGAALAVWVAEPQDHMWAFPNVVRARRLDGSGRGVGEPITVIEGPWLSRVAFDGTVFRVFTWNGDRTRLVRVTPEGIVLDPGGVLLEEGIGADDVACAPGGSCVLVASDDITRLAADGSLDEVIPLSVVGQGWPRIVRVAGGYRFVLRTSQGIFAGALDDEPSSLVRLVPLAPDHDESPEIAARADGSVVVTWCSPQGLRWSVLDAALERLVPDGLLAGWCGAGLNLTSLGFALAGTDGRLVEIDVAEGLVRERAMSSGWSPWMITVVSTGAETATWLRIEATDMTLLGDHLEDLFGVPVELETLTPASEELLAVEATPQIEASVAGDAGGHAVVFRDFRRGPGDERDRLRLFDASGEPLAGASVELPSKRGGWPPAAIARSPAQTVVAWSDRDDSTGDVEILVRRFRSDGSSPDAQPVVVRQEWTDELAVAATDGAIVVATGHMTGDRTVVTVIPVGPVLSPLAPIELAGGWALRAAVKGEEIWVRHGNALSRFGADGATLALGVATTGGAWGDHLACSEITCVVATHDAEQTVLVELFPDGTTGPALLTDDASGPRSLAWNGETFTSVRNGGWVDDGFESLHLVTWFDPSSTAVVDEGSWTTLDITDEGDDTWPRVAGLEDGASVAVYPDVATARLRSRVLRPEPDVASGGGGSRPSTVSAGGADGSGGAAPSSASAGGGGDGGGTSSSGSTGGDGGGTPSSASAGGGGAGGDGTPSSASAGGGGAGGDGTPSSASAGGEGGSTQSTTSAGGGEGEVSSTSTAAAGGGDSGTSASSGSTGGGGEGQGGATASSTSASSTGDAATSSSSSAGGSGGDDAAAAPDASRGCSCQVPRTPDRSSFAAFAGVIALAWRRRRTRAAGGAIRASRSERARP